MAMARRVIRAIRHRLYQNYFMGSRLSEFRRILDTLRDTGYEFLTVEALVGRLLPGSSHAGKTCALRCDVDSDSRTARELFRELRKAGAVGTWYFRLATLDAPLMREIAGAGHEIGYHFEELATIAKRRGIRSADHIQQYFEEMQNEFCRNLETRYFPAAGAYPKTVASHGDFANRFLKVTNSCLVTENIRRRFGIVAETSDPLLTNATELRRFSDQAAPKWWHPHEPTAHLPQGSDLMYILFHPRQWRTRWLENTALDIERVVDSVRYRINRKRLNG